MKPIKFDGANQCWQPPKNWSRSERCDTLWAEVTDDGRSISCWRPTIKEILRFLFGKPVRLTVVGHQPPVALEI